MQKKLKDDQEERNMEDKKDLGSQSFTSGVDIFNYLAKVKIDFEEFVNDSIKEHADLSFLELKYTDGDKPDYPNVHIQQYYLLRYAFGFTYMYKCMYKCILRDDYTRQKFIKNDLEVLSAGCGARQDYLGFIYALRELKKENVLKKDDDIKINYKGIDLVKWKYPIYRRGCDTIYPKEPERISFSGYLRSLNELTADIVVFPFSISEFADEDFQYICEALAELIQKDDVYIMTTLRYKETFLDEPQEAAAPHDISKSKDYLRSEKICEKMIKAGYTPHEIEEPAEDMEKRRIRLLNPEGEESTLYQGIPFYYYKRYTKDGLFDILEQNCSILNKNPMINKSSVRYRIIHFTRN